MGHTGMNPEAVDELIEKRKDEMKKEGDAEDTEVEDLEEGPQTTTPNYPMLLAKLASAPINVRKLVDKQKRKDDREQRRKDDLDLLKRAGVRRGPPVPGTRDASRIRELETFLSFRPEKLNEEETKELVMLREKETIKADRKLRNKAKKHAFAKKKVMARKEAAKKKAQRQAAAKKEAARKKGMSRAERKAEALAIQKKEREAGVPTTVFGWGEDDY